MVLKKDMKRERKSRRPGGLVTGLLFVLLAVAPLGTQAADFGRELADSLGQMYQGVDHSNLSGTTAVLEDYLAHAETESPAVRRAYYAWKAAVERTGYVGGWPDPVFTFGSFLEKVETRVGPQERRYSLKQSIPLFGTSGAKKNVARQAANSAYRRYESAKLRLAYEIKAAYHDLYYLGRNIALTTESFELLTFWEAVARAKYKVALKQHPDLIKVQVELGKLEDQLATLRDKIEPATARLRAAVGLSHDVGITIPVSLSANEAAISYETVLTRALESNPDLAALVHQIGQAQAGLTLAGKASLPNIVVGIDYIETGEAMDPAMIDSGKDPIVVGVGINLPVWWGKNSAKKNEASARLNAARYNHADAKNRLAALVRNLVFQHADALRKTGLYRDGLIPKAEQALNASYTSYQSGQTDFLSLLDAQRQLLAFQLQFESALSSLATRRAEIEMLIGTRIESTN